MVNPADDKPLRKHTLRGDVKEKSDSLEYLEEKSLREHLIHYFEEQPEDREEWMNVFLRTVLDIVRRGRVNLFKVCLEYEFPINIQSDKTGFTILHMAAACGARDILRILIKRDDCDYLLRDKQGRLASELAYLGGPVPDVAVSRLLGIKEKKQADEVGVKLTRRPQ